MSAEDAWRALRGVTAARIGLGRSGSAQTTRAVLDFAMAHALARDAVRTPLAWDVLEAALAALGQRCVHVASAAPDRDVYLRRPDLGRRLAAASRERVVAACPEPRELLIVIGDGLSSTGVAANAPGLVAALLRLVQDGGWTLGPIVLAAQARVALGDEVAESVGARAVLMLIGERPGLSSPDSLGAYLTYAPRVGRRDAERNCVSNIRAGGLAPAEAAFRLAWLLRAAFVRRLSGVQLKDESDVARELANARPGALARDGEGH
ncbi:MAG: ethanolamine ammonia-lyase subunit EutC [Gammaproteobacteria bacterium]|nr:ethanolamine ammonia-lyase subunit EutC [Gammaproteobacteria bacterium]MBI5615410.1 ethanolamine ammonia-lyase subunit EutC [Gammaproteobacteria bacterium]